MQTTVRHLLCLLLLTAWSGAAAPALFEEDMVLAVELVGPFQAMFEDPQERTERPVMLRHGGTELRVAARVRGKSRIRLCDFPPLRLNFSETETAGTAFAGQDKLKLVTHCRHSDASEINALEEYAAYRVFNLISEVGYRVRLLHLTYADEDAAAGLAAMTRYGFLIEPDAQLAARVGGELVSVPQVALPQFDADHAALVYVFQYLVGNTDWSFVTADGDEHCCHNGDLLRIGGVLHYVPYDFDLAGIVNAPYARPDPRMKLRSVRQRRYRGFCTDPDTLRRAVRRITSLQGDIEAMLRSIPGLEGRETEKLVDYINGFFERAAKEDKLLKSLDRQCLRR